MSSARRERFRKVLVPLDGSQNAEAAIPWVNLAGLLACLAGCALGGPESVEPRESYPHAGTPVTTPRAKTGLAVDTETFLSLADSDEGPQMLHTGYTLYDSRGRRISYVRNFIGDRDLEPTEIVLEPGRYLVLLERPYGHPPLFWVTVEEGRLTRVTLRPSAP